MSTTARRKINQANSGALGCIPSRQLPAFKSTSASSLKSHGARIDGASPIIYSLIQFRFEARKQTYVSERCGEGEVKCDNKEIQIISFPLVFLANAGTLEWVCERGAFLSFRLRPGELLRLH